MWNRIKIFISFAIGWFADRWFQMNQEIEDFKTQNDALLTEQKKQFQREIRHEERLIEITSDLSDSDISRLLSTYPDESGEAHAPDNGKSGSEKLPDGKQ